MTGRATHSHMYAVWSEDERYFNQQMRKREAEKKKQENAQLEKKEQ